MRAVWFTFISRLRAFVRPGAGEADFDHGRRPLGDEQVANRVAVGLRERHRGEIVVDRTHPRWTVDDQFSAYFSNCVDRCHVF